MAVKSGFFNSQAGDRLYSAEDVNSFFDGFVTEGVLSPVDDGLVVSASGAMTVSVASGKAWFLSTWLTNTQPHQLILNAADLTFDRIDLVVLDFNKTNRANTIKVLTGTPAAVPEWPAYSDTATHKQVPLAAVAVAANASSIDPVDITNLIGTEYCPVCTGLLEQISGTDLLTQWDADYHLWKWTIETDLEEIDTSGTLAEIQEMRERPLPNRNILLNGDMVVNQRGVTSITGYDYADNALDAYPMVDRWRLRMVTGVYMQPALGLNHIDLGNDRRALRITSETSYPAIEPSTEVLLQQKIEGIRCGEILKGTADARELYLSFWAKTNQGGNYVVELRDHQNNRSISHVYTMVGDGTYRRFDWLIPPDYTGELKAGNTNTMTLIFWLMGGTDYTSGTLNTVWETRTTGNKNKRAVGLTGLEGNGGEYWEITDIQLEVGSIRTPFERRGIDVETELCQRYREYWDVYTLIGWCYHDDAEWADTRVRCWNGPMYKIPKRAIPSNISVLDKAGSELRQASNNFNYDYHGTTEPRMYNGTQDSQRFFPTMDIRAATIPADGTQMVGNLYGFFVDAEIEPQGP